MAVQTKQFCRISSHDQVIIEVFEEYEDSDYRTINDEGEPDDFRVIRWFGTNHSTHPITISVLRTGDKNWVERTVPAGDSFTQNAGGVVKYEFDVPSWTYS